MTNISIRLRISQDKTFRIVTNTGTNKQGLQCSICNNTCYESICVEKKYCPHCNIHHEYANYLSFVE